MKRWLIVGLSLGLLFAWQQTNVRQARAEGEPLPLAVEGSKEAQELREAHQSDLEGAMESEEEAASHQKALEREKSRDEKEESKPHSYNESPRGMPLGGSEADLAIEPESTEKHEKAAPVRARNSDDYSAAPAAVDKDLAISSEPEWLKKGGNPENPPAHRLGGEAEATLPAVSVSFDPKSGQIHTPPFIFNPWSANLSNQDRAVLEKIAELMKEKPNAVPKLRIEAYTDNSGDPAINESLTIARANVVKAYLILKGVGVHRLEAVGLGEKNPLVSNKTKSGRAKNRRIEFKVVK